MSLLVSPKKSTEEPADRDTTGKLSGTARSKLAVLLYNELLIDCLTILLLATGLSLAFAAITVLEAPVWSFSCLAALSLILIFLLGSRWWITPALLLFSTTGFTAWRSIQGDLNKWGVFFRDFFFWAWQGAPYHEVYTENGSLLVLQTALIFTVTLAVYLLVRKLYSFPLVLCLTIGSFVLIQVLDGTELSVAACVTASGIILLLPRVYAGYVGRNSSGVESRAALQVIALPAAILALLLSLWIVPEDTARWRSRGLNNFFGDLGQLLGGPFQGAAPQPSNFRLSSLGFQPEEGRLGGPVTLTDETFLTVTEEQPILLRGAVLDSYTGRNWSVGEADVDLRYGSFFWRRYQREAFDRDKPVGGRDTRDLYDSLTKEIRLLVTYQSNRYTALFSGGNVESARFLDNRLNEPFYFNMRSELYLHLRIPQRTRLEVHTRIWDSSSPSFDEDFVKLEASASEQEDAQYVRICERYTDLPDTLPASVRELTLKITKGMKSPYEKARAIEHWLAENCAYTLEPAMPPEESDFVAHFLDTREGYCTYFASAMSVMARCAGLPSRYVTGFALEKSPGEDSYTATGKTAHAWTEVYFQGLGWKEFDPLGWDASRPLNLDASNVEEPHVPESQPLAEEEPRSSDTGTNGLGQASERAPVNWVPLLIGAAVTLVLLFAARGILRAIMDSKFKLYEWDRVTKKIADLSERLEYYYADVIRQLELLNLEARPGETLLTYPVRVDRRYRFEDSTFGEVAYARMRLYFAEELPSTEEIEVACFFHENLEYTLMETLGPIPYFFRRAVRFRARHYREWKKKL